MNSLLLRLLLSRRKRSGYPGQPATIAGPGQQTPDPCHCARIGERRVEWWGFPRLGWPGGALNEPATSIARHSRLNSSTPSTAAASGPWHRRL